MKYDKRGIYSVIVDSFYEYMNLLKRIELFSDVCNSNYPTEIVPPTGVHGLIFSIKNGLRLSMCDNHIYSIILSEDEFIEMCSDLCPPTIDGYGSSNIPWYNHVSKFANA